MVDASLSPGQVDDFVERGWTLLSGAFPVEVAEAVRRDIGRRIGIDLAAPEEWGKPRVWLQELLTTPPFTAALSERFRAASPS